MNVNLNLAMTIMIMGFVSAIGLGFIVSLLSTFLLKRKWIEYPTKLKLDGYVFNAVVFVMTIVTFFLVALAIIA